VLKSLNLNPTVRPPTPTVPRSRRPRNLAPPAAAFVLRIRSAPGAGGSREGDFMEEIVEGMEERWRRPLRHPSICPPSCSMMGLGPGYTLQSGDVYTLHSE
jgi:hypothetical protein